MRYFIVCNPGSRGGKGRRTIEGYRRLLDTAKADYQCCWTKELAEAAPLTREALARGFDAAVASGGDGTINRVLNGFFSETGEVARAHFGVLYAGTSPDFCRFHGLPAGGKEAVHSLLSGEVRPIDLCEIRYHRASGEPAVSRLACSANVGLGPRIAHLANRNRKFIGDVPGTLLATISSVMEGRTFAADLTLDGVSHRIETQWNISAGKNPFLASGLKLGLDVTPADGRLFVFSLSGVGRGGLLALLPKIYTGQVGGDPRFFRGTCSHLRVDARGGEVGVEFDGDPAGVCPIELTVLPRAISLLGAKG